MEIGVCASVHDIGKFKELFDYVEEGVRSFLAPHENQKVFNKSLNAMKACGLPVKAVCNFLPSDLRSVGPDVNIDRVLDWAEKSFKRAQKAGTEIVVFGSGGSRKILFNAPEQEVRDQFVTLLKMMGSIAKKYDVTIVVEPLNSDECNFINSVGEAAEIVKAVQQPSVQLLADIYHMAYDGQGPEDILEYGTMLRHVHIAELENRAAPGTEKFDFLPYLKALKKAGYDRRISIECRWNNMQEEAIPSVEYLKEQLTEAGY